MQRRDPNLRIALIAFAAFASMAGIVVYVQSKPSATDATAKRSPQDIFKEIDQQLKQRDQALLSSRWAKVLVDKDFEAVMSVMNAPKQEKDRADFIEALDRLAERKLLDEKYTEEEQYRLTRILTNFVYENRASFLGAKARPMTRSFRALSRLPDAISASEEEKRILAMIDLEDQDTLRFLALSVAAQWKKVPKQVLNEILTGMRSKEAHEAQGILQLLPLIRDHEARQTILTALATGHRKIAEPLRPLASKLLIAQYRLLKPAEQRELDGFAQEIGKTEDPMWKDVFLYYLETVGGSERYVTELNRMSQDRSDPIQYERVRDLLAKGARTPAGAQTEKKP